MFGLKVIFETWLILLVCIVNLNVNITHRLVDVPKEYSKV